MYNGIGLRTVRGSGTNGYVQRNLSHVDAARTRQTLARAQRGAAFGGKAAAPAPRANADLLLHERKRRVEVALLELTLEMEERGCDEDEILDKVARERERLLAQVTKDVAADATATTTNSSSHARQRRKEEENARMKDAFGIASDHVPGESFDPEMQERRRQERIAKREQERAEREAQRQARLREREERQKEAERRRDRSHPRVSAPPRRSRSDDRRGRRASRSRSDDRRGRRASRSRSAGRNERGGNKPSRRESPSRSRSRSRRPASRSRRSPENASRRKTRRRSASRSSSSGSSRSRSRSRSRGKGVSSRRRRDARSRSRSRSSSGSDSSRSASRTPPRRRTSDLTPAKRGSSPRESDKKATVKVLDLSKPATGAKSLNATTEANPEPVKDEPAKASGSDERVSEDPPKRVRQTSRWSERKVPVAVAPPAAVEPALERVSHESEPPPSPSELPVALALAFALTFALGLPVFALVVVVLSLSVAFAVPFAFAPARLASPS